MLPSNGRFPFHFRKVPKYQLHEATSIGSARVDVRSGQRNYERGVLEFKTI